VNAVNPICGRLFPTDVVGGSSRSMWFEDSPHPTYSDVETADTLCYPTPQEGTTMLPAAAANPQTAKILADPVTQVTHARLQSGNKAL